MRIAKVALLFIMLSFVSRDIEEEVVDHCCLTCYACVINLVGTILNFIVWMLNRGTYDNVITKFFCMDVCNNYNMSLYWKLSSNMLGCITIDYMGVS